LTVSIPRNNKEEIEYICHVLFQQNLNIQNIRFEYRDKGNILLKGEEGSIEIENNFSNKEYQELFTLNNIPTEKKELNIYGEKISCLYGNSEFRQEGPNYYLGGDIIGSTFFLLTQWESSLLQCDQLSRYKYEGSTIERLNIYSRPIVNEYIAALKTLLHKINIKCGLNAYRPIFTCDVDSITKYKNFRNLLGGLRHRGLNKSIFREYFESRSDKKRDVYYSFDYLFDKLERKGIDSIFFFMVEKNHPVIDTMDYDINEELIQSVFKRIMENKYSIGLHPSINSYDSTEKINKQKIKLEKAIKNRVDHIRQHYLQYDVRKTLAIMDENEFISDSSMQFEKGMGFSTGICTEFALYDLNQRKQLSVNELPLVIMKKKDYVKDVDSSFQSMKKLIDTCKKYNGEYSVLFHNADLETFNEKILFEQTLEVL
jgi:hypothetical protein